MKKVLLLLFAASVISCGAFQNITSPDGLVKLGVDGRSGAFSVSYNGREVLSGKPCMSLADNVPAWNPDAGVRIDRKGQSLILSAGDFSLEFLVRNDGVAYRFTTTRGEETVVFSEPTEFSFAEDPFCTYARQLSDNPMKTSFEAEYVGSALSEWPDCPSFLPASALLESGIRVTFAQSGIGGYPIAFIRPSGPNSLRLDFPKVPGNDFIASSSGARSYPWRIIRISVDDKDLATDSFVRDLAQTADADIDWSWVKPGFCSWEWWNDWGLENVPFKPGVNNETYRYYIDFAAANGLEYVLLDEGWGKRGPGRNLLTPIPELDLEGLVNYAASKNVKLILWCVFDRLEPDCENVFSTYGKMGIAGFKPDFLSRADQIAVDQVIKVAECGARHHMLLDFHGTFPLYGLEVTYPNILSEGVLGLEWMKGIENKSIDFPRHDCILPYLRQMAGPFDYTPGAMLNFASGKSETNWKRPGSMGTRAHQVALYVVFESPLSMLCDSPTNYMKEQETLDFIASIPRCGWKEKKVLAGELGKNYVVARKAVHPDGTPGWYVAGISDLSGLNCTLPLDFLGEGEWTVTLFADGESAAVEGQDYTVRTFNVSSSDALEVRIAPAGGFVAAFSENQRFSNTGE